MTMHLVHPSLSTTGKKKGKQKFRNANEARKARELAESWEKLKKKWDVQTPSSSRKTSIDPLKYSLSIPSHRDTKHIKSVDTGLGTATVAKTMVYTGTKVKGIATMHKSNAVPVFSDEEAIDISRMRR